MRIIAPLPPLARSSQSSFVSSEHLICFLWRQVT